MECLFSIALGSIEFIVVPCELSYMALAVLHVCWLVLCRNYLLLAAQSWVVLRCYI